MITLSAYFFTAFGLSALGSLPVGMITLKVAEKTIYDGYRSGLMLSLGATVIEFLYTVVALIGMDIFLKNLEVNSFFNVLAMTVFFILGFYHLFKKAKPALHSKGEYKTFDFLKGILLASMNMLIFPFWVFLAVWLKGYGFAFSSYEQILVFSIGSALGALVIFLAYSRLGRLVVNKMQSVSFYTAKAVGMLFLLLGIYQLIRLF